MIKRLQRKFVAIAMGSLLLILLLLLGAVNGVNLYQLNARANHLLHLLAAYEGQLVSHSEIIQIIDKERDGKPATLTESSNYMRNLRKKLCLDSETSRYILKSVKRRGYLLIDRQEMN